MMPLPRLIFEIFGNKTSRSWDKPPLMEDEIKTRIAVKKSIIKARIITGTLVLQKDRHIFNKFDTSNTIYTTLNIINIGVPLSIVTKCNT